MLAALAGGYLKKGRLLYVEGRLHWSSWQAADGSQRRGCEVRVGNLQVQSTWLRTETSFRRLTAGFRLILMVEQK